MSNGLDEITLSVREDINRKRALTFGQIKVPRMANSQYLYLGDTKRK